MSTNEVIRAARAGYRQWLTDAQPSDPDSNVRKLWFTDFPKYEAIARFHRKWAKYRLAGEAAFEAPGDATNQV